VKEWVWQDKRLGEAVKAERLLRRIEMEWSLEIVFDSIVVNGEKLSLSFWV
jgi:hypothetical protein